jgi:hypothetical protein
MPNGAGWFRRYLHECPNDRTRHGSFTGTR